MENYIEVQEALDLWKAQFNEDKEQDLPEDVTVQTLWDQPVFELKYQELLDILLMAMGAARHTSAPEPTGLCLDDSKRPDDITLFSWKNGMQLVWDVTCPDTLAPSYYT